MKRQNLILGASASPYRYSNRAIHMLRDQEEAVLALGRHADTVRDVEILTKLEDLPEGEIDTITLYLNTRNQESYKDWIITKKPRRVIFNPGSENMSFAKELKDAGIEPVFACTLVMLRTKQY